MVYDYSKLKEKMQKGFLNKSELTKIMNLSEELLNLKLNSELEFTQNEIKLISALLRLEVKEIKSYFFITKV